MIIDATNSILGRLATVVAKRSLLGDEIDIINCEKAVIVGKRDSILAKYKQKRDRGIPSKGPFIERGAERFVRRIIRGMLPYDKNRGREAFRKIKCYTGVPDQLKEKKSIKLKEASMEKCKEQPYTTVKEICNYLGGML